jgi:hypothetical protein
MKVVVPQKIYSQNMVQVFFLVSKHDVSSNETKITLRKLHIHI